jgi:uncharacterized protein YacL
MYASIAYRFIGAIAVMLVGWQVGSEIGSGSEQPRNAMLGIVVGAICGFVASPLIVEWPYRALRRVVSHASLSDLVYGVVGLILGLVVAALLSYPLSFLPYWLGHVLPAIAAIVCAYLGVTLLPMRGRELTHLVRSRSTPVDLDPPDGNQYLVDTSAIIDGRIADVSESGFLYGTLVVPRFVLSELQHIAGSPDPLRRNRGRRGLEILNRLQKDSATLVSISDLEAREAPDVDGKLVNLARQLQCPVVTNDFGLNRIAELQGVRVLNINQLANALKPVVLPGEEMAVHIIQEGKELNQGVGYLDDGTMIVVENGRRYLHNDLEIVVTRVLQTVAGRMIFAQPKSNGRE